MADLAISSDLRLPLETVTQAVAIVGKRRVGKSYLVAKLVEQLHAAGQPVAVIDPKGDLWGFRSSADGAHPGLPILILGGQHGDVPLDVHSGETVATFIVEQRVSALLDLSDFRKGQVATFMAAFLESLYRLKAQEQYRTPLMLVIDEADAIAPQRPQEGEQRMLGAAEDIVRRGGQRGLGCVMATQRTAVLNKNVLTQCEVLIALRTIAPQDLKALDDWVDVHGTREQRAELMASLPSLPVGTAWVWSPGWPTETGIFQKVQVARRATFDSTATPKPGEHRVQARTLADVDLAVLQERLAATIEQAKANDPAELRKRIAALEQQLRQRPTEPRVQVREVETLVDRPVPVLDEALLGDMRVLWTRLDDTARDLVGIGIDLDHALRDAGERLARAPAPRPAPEPPAPKQPVPQLAAVPNAHKRPPPFKALDRPATPAPGEVTGPMQRILDALATLEALRVRPAQRGPVGAIAGYAYTGGNFQNLLGRLRSAGLVEYPGGNLVVLTDAGRALGRARTEVRSLEDLHDAWYAQLSQPQARLLRVLERQYPGALSREAVAAETGYAATGGNFQNLLGGLRSLGLIDYPDRGQVVATELLFPAGLVSG